jgi:hypothetical protein
MAEGDRERDAETSGDDSAPEEEHAYDPGTGDGDERGAETSGADEDADTDADADADDSDQQEEEEEEEEEKGPAFHPHDRARTEREWAREDSDKEPEPEDPDALGGPSAEEERERESDEATGDEDEDEEEAKGPPAPFRAFMLFVGTIAFLIIGLLLFAAVIAPTYISALILAALWFVAAYYLLGRWTRNRRALRFPIRIAFGGTVLVILLWILINSVNGKTVHEQLVTGQKISDAPPTARIPEKPAKPTPPGNRLLSTGKFESAGAGGVKGEASYIQLQNGTVMVTIKGLDVTSAPTLHVFLATKDGKDVSAHKDLGSLKGNKGDMQYTVPPRTDPRQYKTVVIWNKAFGVPFARAETKLQ